MFLLHPVAAVQGWKHPLNLFLCPFQAQLSTENGSPDLTCGFISDISICHCPNKALYSLFWVQKGSCHILNSSRSHGLSTFSTWSTGKLQVPLDFSKLIETDKSFLWVYTGWLSSLSLNPFEHLTEWFFKFRCLVSPRILTLREQQISNWPFLYDPLWQLRSHSVTWSSYSYSVTSNNHKGVWKQGTTSLTRTQKLGLQENKC